MPPPVLSTEKAQATVALVDPLWIGHHPMYFGQFAASFLRAGARVIGLCPEPDAARLEIQQAATTPEWEQKISLHPLPKGSRSWFRGRFEGDPLRSFQRWQRAASAIDQAELNCGWKTDLVYFPYLDSYLRFLPLSKVPAITIARPWSGLYLRNHHFRKLSPKNRHSPRLLAKGDALLRSPLCREIGVLDERFVDSMQGYTGKNVIPYPDVTQTLLPESDPALTRQILEQAKGRKIIGLIGLEKRKGTLNMMRVALAANERKLPWFFVFAGIFDVSEYTTAEREWLSDIARRSASGQLDNIHFDPEASRIPNEPEFNSLFKSFDLAWVVYEGFQGSSGALSKAAAFEIPSLATSGECIGQRIERFRTGLTIPEGDSEQATDAIQRLLAGIDQHDQPLHPNYEGYRQAHSLARLDAILAALL